MIFSSHSVDKKIISIADLKYEISVLESEFLENRKSVMRLKMESNVISTPAAMTDPGIAYPEDDIAINGL